MGLQLSGSIQLEGNLLVTGSANNVFENVLVSGKLTAQEIETQLVSSSIIYSSGSNKFGDLVTDTQQFTGSVDVSGSLSVNGNLQATTLVKTGGISTQFLKADGSVDSNSYALTSSLDNYLLLSGGTLTGALNGTSAVFSGGVNDVISATSTASTTAIKLNNTNANDFGSNVAFQSNSVNRGFVGLVGSLIGNTDHSICLFGTTGQSVKFFTNSNTSPRLTLDVSTGAATFSSSVKATSASIGFSSAAPTNGMIVQGNVGIGTTDTNGARLKIMGGALASNSSDSALFISSQLTTGRTGTYQSTTLSSIHNWFDDSTIEIASGVTPSFISGISVTGNNASINSGTVRIITTGSERLRITSAGNVGIGTTTPSEKFTVAGSARFTGQAINFSTGLRGVNIDITDASGLARIYAVSGTGIGGDLSLGTVGLERLRITNQGNVGIGTDQPGQKLVLEDPSACRLDVVRTSGATGRISSTSDTVFVGSTTSHPLVLFTDDIPRLEITSAGVVQIALAGIPTSDPIIAGQLYRNNIGQLFISLGVS